MFTSCHGHLSLLVCTQPCQYQGIPRLHWCALRTQIWIIACKLCCCKGGQRDSPSIIPSHPSAIPYPTPNVISRTHPHRHSMTTVVESPWDCYGIVNCFAQGTRRARRRCCWVGQSIDVCQCHIPIYLTRRHGGHGAHTPQTSFHAGVRHRRGISVGLPSDDCVGGTNITCGGARSSIYPVSQPTHVSQMTSATYRLRGDCTAPAAPCNDASEKGTEPTHPPPTSFHAGVRHRRGISLGLPSDDCVGGANT
jgi:hypothetical protein